MNWFMGRKRLIHILAQLARASVPSDACKQTFSRNLDALSHRTTAAASYSQYPGPEPRCDYVEKFAV